jgi:hypothetical protein
MGVHVALLQMVVLQKTELTAQFPDWFTRQPMGTFKTFVPLLGIQILLRRRRKFNSVKNLSSKQHYVMMEKKRL